jgi:alpha-galactosidase
MTQFYTLHSAAATLVLEACERDAPVVRHWGAATLVDGLGMLVEGRGPASFSLDGDVPLSLAPPVGLGWFGPEALRVRRRGCAQVVAWTDSDMRQEHDAISVTLIDRVARVRLELRLALVDGGALQIAAKACNDGDCALEVEWLASTLLPLPASSREIVSWRGRHNAELVECREPMPEQRWLREGRRGISGHGGPPGLFVIGEGATLHAGPVHALQLCWSGDSIIAVERDDEGFWILSAGAVLQPGEIVLAPGEAWAAPAALAVFSDEGRNGASAGFHAAVRQLVRWPGGERSPRKVHLNSWEACYFDHDEERIGALAEAAAAIGIERFVLDDGWFRGRNDDTAGLGDWTTDAVKYPGGLSSLARRVTDLGMEFGLWVEPEMINPDSDLYRAHPDWALALDGRARPTARNQLVLDMSRADVRDYLFGCIDALLRELPIGYLKWDHNRDLAPTGGTAQVLGTYDLFARVRSAHPTVEIEACAGGGGRSDAGMAPYVHRYWASDNIDAVSRVPIQRGFLSFLPPEMMGAHVGASPAHATGRSQSLAFRAAVAMPGHFGVEMDPRTLDDAARAELADWIAFHRQWRDLLHGGQVWQGDGADGLRWQAQGHADDFLLFAIRVGPPRDRRPQPLVLPHLGIAAAEVRLLRIADGRDGHPAATAPLFDRMTRDAVTFPAGWLAASGLPMPPLKGETVAIFHVRTP